jgi:kynurenine formamidase
MIRKYLFPSLLIVCAQAWANTNQYVDLTHDYSSQTLHWPGSPPFKVTHVETYKNPYVIARNYSSNEHVGTHIDAPSHLAKGHPSVDNIPLSQLIGSAVKIDVSNEANHNPDYLISINDFEQWEKLHGSIPQDSIVLLSTGYGNYWPNMKKYSGSTNPHDLHFPGLSPDAAAWLINERKIKAVGIDTFSIDYGQTKTFMAHQILTKNNIPILENVASMERLPVNNFMIFALPMKIKDGTGAPVRIIAQYNTNQIR